MLITRIQRENLKKLFDRLKLNNKQGKDRDVKIEQIISYLEVIHAGIKKYSKKRDLVFVESCAGKCYLSLLVYYFYSVIDPRNVTIHCVDLNMDLMEKAQSIANEFNFKKMYFHSENVLKYVPPENVTLVYSLHACDIATDGTLFLGIRAKAKLILSVSCCQHTIKKTLRNSRYKGITKHSVFKDRIVYMVGDSIRSILLEKHRYKTNIFEFISSRYTDKNIMIRAQFGNDVISPELDSEYDMLIKEFRVKPVLEGFLSSIG